MSASPRAKCREDGSSTVSKDKPVGVPFSPKADKTVGCDGNEVDLKF